MSITGNVVVVIPKSASTICSKTWSSDRLESPICRKSGSCLPSDSFHSNYSCSSNFPKAKSNYNSPSSTSSGSSIKTTSSALSLSNSMTSISSSSNDSSHDYYTPFQAITCNAMHKMPVDAWDSMFERLM